MMVYSEVLKTQIILCMILSKTINARFVFHLDKKFIGTEPGLIIKYTRLVSILLILEMGIL
jgi:hypothetical protein